HQPWKSYAVLTTVACAVRHVVLVQQDRTGRVKWMVTGRREIGEEVLDARLMGDRRARVRAARGGLRRILAAKSMHVIHLLGPHLIRLEVLVTDRPGRRNAV